MTIHSSPLPQKPTAPHLVLPDMASGVGSSIRQIVLITRIGRLFALILPMLLISCEKEDEVMEPEPEKRILDFERTITQNSCTIIDERNADTLLFRQTNLNCAAIEYGSMPIGNRIGSCHRSLYGTGVNYLTPEDLDLRLEVIINSDLEPVSYNDILLLAYNSSRRVKVGCMIRFSLNGKNYATSIHGDTPFACANQYGSGNKTITKIDTTSVDHCIGARLVYGIADVNFRGYAYNTQSPRDSIGPLLISTRFAIKMY